MSFSEKVYALCSQIPRGKVTTYKAIAEKLGTKSYRAVGQALRCSHFSLRVPCHRVVRCNGFLGGFMGWKEGGKVAEKKKMLETESVAVVNGKIDLSQYGFFFEKLDLEEVGSRSQIQKKLRSFYPRRKYTKRTK